MSFLNGRIYYGVAVSSQKDPLVNASERGRPAQGNIVENPESLASPIHSQSILQKPVSTSGESDIETVMLSDKSDSESGNSRDVSPVGSTQTLSPVVGGNGTYTCKSRNENPQKLTQLSSRSHPRHLVGKRTAQQDTIIDITSDSQVNSNFPNRWSPASLTFNNYFLLIFISIYNVNNHK